MTSSNSSGAPVFKFPLPPDHVYSTGQTMYDFIELGKVNSMMKDATGGGKHALPPALLDPNYIPPNRGPALFAGFVVLTIIATVAVVLRTYSRLRYTPKKLLAEDWTILLSLASFLVLAGICCWGCLDLQWGYEMLRLYNPQHAKNRHCYLCPHNTRLHSTLLNPLRPHPLHPPSIPPIRLPLRLHLQRANRLHGPPRHRDHNWERIPMWYRRQRPRKLGSYPSRTRQLLLNRLQLDPSLPKHSMRYNRNVTPSQSSTRDANKTFWERFRIWALLGRGCVTWIAAIVRFYYVWVIAQHGDVHSVYNAMLCTHFECSIGIVCSCAPAIKSLVSFVFYDKKNRDSVAVLAAVQHDNQSPNRGGGAGGAGPVKHNRKPSLVMYGIDASALDTMVSTVDNKEGGKINEVDLEKNMSQFSAMRTLSMESDIRKTENRSDEEVDVEKNLSSSCRPLRTYS